MKDRLDQLNKRLGQLIELAKAGAFGGRSLTVNESGGFDEGRARLFSSGPTFTELAADDYEDAKVVELGGVRESFNVRTDTALLVAFNDPAAGGGEWVPVRPQDSPFTIGGDNPVNTDTVYLSLQDESNGPAQYHILAH